jgi:hypothetical protein
MQVLHIGTIQDEFTNSVLDREEIWGILKGMRNDASSASNGLNASFYKPTWNGIGDDITRLVQNTYCNDYLSHQFN